MAPVKASWKPGTVVWARVSGWPWWPALVVPYEEVYFLPLSQPAPRYMSREITVMFFRDGTLAVLPRKDIVEFQSNLQYINVRGTHASSVQLAYLKAREWIESHGTAGELPFLNPNIEAPGKSGQDPEEMEIRTRIGVIRAQRMMIDAKRMILIKEIKSLTGELEKRRSNN